jgi:hypothetical protein
MRESCADRDARRLQQPAIVMTGGRNAKDGSRFALCDHADTGFNRHLQAPSRDSRATARKRGSLHLGHVDIGPTRPAS